LARYFVKFHESPISIHRVINKIRILITFFVHCTVYVKNPTTLKNIGYGKMLNIKLRKKRKESYSQ